MNLNSLRKAQWPHVYCSDPSGPGSSPSWGHCVVFLDKTLYSHSASLHPGEKWVWANLMLSCDGLASHPGGSRNTLSRFMLQKLG